MARTGNFDHNILLDAADDNLRQWISYIVGNGRKYFTEDTIEALCKNDPQVYFEASVLWQIVSNWIHGIKVN
jgi:hypothetical protein